MMKKILLTVMAAAMCFNTMTVLAEENTDSFQSCPAVEYTGDVSELVWADDLEEGDVVGEPNPDALIYYSSYLELYDDYVYKNPNTVVGDLPFYVYDPTKHGFDPEGEYPVSIWFHGGGNQTLGKTAIAAGGAAAYACDEYQQAIGGMYIIVPIANQETCWTDGTCSAIKGMYDIVTSSHNTTDELFVCGTSAGGMMVNRWLEQYAYMTDGVLWMSTVMPSSEEVKAYSDLGIHMWHVTSAHDEVISLDWSYEEGVEAYDGIENYEYTILEWARWGNGMIATLGENNSISGQHCNCVQVTRNLILDDGTPDDPNHPNGVTGWFADTLAELRAE